MRSLYLRAELRLQGHLRLQSAGPPLNGAGTPGPEPATGSGPPIEKEAAMRMLFIMASSFALTLGLRIVDPPVASAVTAPASVKAGNSLVLVAPRAGARHAGLATARKARRP